MVGEKGKLVLYTRWLRRAVRVLGGAEKLRRRLHVHEQDLIDWLIGRRPVPDEIFERAVRVVAAAILENAITTTDISRI